MFSVAHLPPGHKTAPPGTVPRVERRDTSPLGVARRRQFDDSLVRLRALGLSPEAIEYYRRAARLTGKLPHELVARTAEKVAREARLFGILAALGNGPA